jgi:hypothetical protein
MKGLRPPKPAAGAGGPSRYSSRASRRQVVPGSAARVTASPRCLSQAAERQTEDRRKSLGRALAADLLLAYPALGGRGGDVPSVAVRAHPEGRRVRGATLWTRHEQELHARINSLPRRWHPRARVLAKRYPRAPFLTLGTADEPASDRMLGPASSRRGDQRLTLSDVRDHRTWRASANASSARSGSPPGREPRSPATCDRRRRARSRASTGTVRGWGRG